MPSPLSSTRIEAVAIDREDAQDIATRLFAEDTGTCLNSHEVSVLKLLRKANHELLNVGEVQGFCFCFSSIDGEDEIVTAGPDISPTPPIDS